LVFLNDKIVVCGYLPMLQYTVINRKRPKEIRCIYSFGNNVLNWVQWRMVYWNLLYKIWKNRRIRRKNAKTRQL